MIIKLRSPKFLRFLSIAFLMSLLFSGGHYSFAQSSTHVASAMPDEPAVSDNDYKDSTKPAKKFDLSPVPVIAVNPTTGLLGGLLLGVNFKMGDPLPCKQGLPPF
jgi:hypothetical protein